MSGAVISVCFYDPMHHVCARQMPFQSSRERIVYVNGKQECIMVRPLSQLLTLGMIISAVAIFGSPGFSDELADSAAFWREKAFLCKSDSGAFPSKSAVNPNDCDDGDMTLFNGLLCASGEKVGCDAVAHSQDGDGRWWRSPRQIKLEYSKEKHDVSFSPDQALGVLHYVLKAPDPTKFSRWINWINTHRQTVNRAQVKNAVETANINMPPFLFELLALAVGQLPPHPTYCTDDIDLRCSLRHGDCITIRKIGNSLGQNSDVCQDYLFMSQVIEKAKSLGVPLGDLLTLGASYFNDAGYPLHLAASQIFLLQRSSGESSEILREAASHLIEKEREPENPFYNYLAGNRARALELTLKKCPQRGKPTLAPAIDNQPQEWAWERRDVDQKWLHSMYWDCIFMANLLQKF